MSTSKATPTFREVGEKLAQWKAVLFGLDEGCPHTEVAKRQWGDSLKRSAAFRRLRMARANRASSLQTLQWRHIFPVRSQ